MQEEAGILVANPKYLGSQAWPFPFSLMLGYTAEYVGGTLTPDGEEIVKLRWFTREELKAEASDLLLPGRLSIARSLIEHWLGEELVTGE
jgi:NAD+ diphosphatase